MRQHLVLFLTASIIFLSQGVQGSNINHDDDGDAPASASAPGVVTSVSTHSGFTLCNPQGLVSMNERFFNSNALASVRGLPFFNPLQDRYMFVMGELASQTGNSTLFMRYHVADWVHFTLPQLEKLVDQNALKDALDAKKPAGQAYFALEALLKDMSQKEVRYYYTILRLCPPLKGRNPFNKA